MKFFSFLDSTFLGTIFVASTALISLSRCATTQVQQAAQETHPKCSFTVLHTNDHHGHPIRFNNFADQNVGGLPARLSYVQLVRKTTKNVLVLDAGDINTGRPESSFFDAEPDIIGYNAIGYDAATLGNHEFDKSPEVLRKQISDATFPFVNANIKFKSSEQKLNPISKVKPYIIKDFGNCKVAVFGLLLATTHETATPSSVTNLEFRDEVEAAQKIVPELRKQSDYVIALTHLGIEDTNNEGSRRLAKLVPGIDLIVDGHTHTKVEQPLLEKNATSQKNVPIVQAYEWGLIVGKTDVTINTNNENSVRFENIPMTSQMPEDENLKRTLQSYAQKLEPILAQKLGEATNAFEFGKHREQETAIANILADATLWTTQKQNADFAFLNTGSIRTGLGRGTITRKDVFEMLPYENTLVIETLNGKQVRELFNTASAVPLGKGAFPAISGAKFEILRTQKKAGKIWIHNQPLNENKQYRIATHGYLAAGGDGYTILSKAQNKFDTSLFLRDALANYIQVKKQIAPVTDNRIIFATETPAPIPTPFPHENTKFQRFSNPEFIPPPKENGRREKCKITFHETTLLQNVAQFALGKIDCEGATRSLILRSTNDGKTWSETGPAFFGSQVYFLQFVNSKEGYAIASYTREGAGDDRVLKTANGGETWQTMPIIPKGNEPWLSALTSFSVQRETKNLIATFIRPGKGISEILTTYTSLDNGNHWKLSRTTLVQSVPAPTKNKQTTSLSQSESLSPKNIGLLPKEVDFDAVGLVK